MNTYGATFFAVCPENNVRIEYRLEIVTTRRIMVEDIIDVVTRLGRGFHEDFADQLFREFGGVQTLRASHHGVEILTTRPVQQHFLKASESVLPSGEVLEHRV